MNSKCLNCSSKNIVKLRNSLESKLAPMSDGSLVSDFNATQFSCRNCSCIFIEYYPEDRLKKYFSDEYNVSDVVQNCQVVIDNQNRPKHSIIHTNLLNEVSSIKRNGHMLEIACGEGNLTRKFASHHKGWECIAIDPSDNANAEYIESNITFIRDFFSPDLIGDTRFDVVVAHGILNRTPPLTLLDQITKVANEDCLVSLEIVVLEDSTYAPFIWDHSFTFLKQTFVDYFEAAGLTLINEYDCGSTIQFVCRYNASKKGCFTGNIDGERYKQTINKYNEHISHWRDIKDLFNIYVATYNNKKVALFGAGLYSAVLTHLIDLGSLTYIVDEIRYGATFLDKSVIDFNQIDEQKENVVFLLCCRKRNLGYIQKKILAHKFKVKSLLI
jgi:ubiquinone/menaquinone biosynthesis C-methylase UbiE